MSMYVCTNACTHVSVCCMLHIRMNVQKTDTLYKHNSTCCNDQKTYTYAHTSTHSCNIILEHSTLDAYPRSSLDPRHLTYNLQHINHQWVHHQLLPLAHLQITNVLYSLK